MSENDGERQRQGYTLNLMLQCRRSQATRDAYRRHLVCFFREMTGGPPTEENVDAFQMQ